MKKRRFLFFSVLFFILAFGIHIPNNASAADTTAPSLVDMNSVQFNTTTATSGSYIEISVEATDADSGIVDLEVRILENDGDAVFYSLDLSFNGSHWTEVIQLEAWWTSQIHISYVRIQDDADNYAHLYNGTDFNTPLLDISDGYDDDTDPYLESVSPNVGFNETSANSGTMVTVFVNATDDASGINKDASYVELETTVYDYVTLERAYLNESSIGLEGSFEVQNWWSSAIYVESIRLVDYAGNSDRLENSTSDYVAPELQIPDGQTDTTAPTLNSVTFNQTTADPGDIVRVQFDASDDLSGISNSFYADLYGTNSTHNIYIEQIESPTFNSSSGYWESHINVSQYWTSEVYITGVSISDKVSNNLSAENGTDYTTNYLSINGATPDFEAPSLISEGFNVSSAAPGDYVKYLVNISDSSGFAEGNVKFDDNNTQSAAEADFYYNDTSGYVEADFQIDPAEDGDYIQADRIYLKDNAGNSVYLYNGSDIIPSILDITNDTSISAPTIINVDFNTTSVTTEEGFNVTVEIDTTLTIDYFIVDLGNSTTDSVVFGYFQEVETNIYQETFSPLYDHAGETFYVSQIEIEDTSGNIYHYDNGTDYFSPTLDVTSSSISDDVIDIKVSPDSGMSEVNETVTFTANITNTLFDMINSQFIVNGTDEFGTDYSFYSNNSLSVNVNSSITIDVNVTFIQDAIYDVNFIVIDDLGVKWQTQISWEVKVSQSEEIKVTASPMNGTSHVDDHVEFKVNITSTFNHDMLGIKLVLNATDANGVEHRFNSTTFDLYANSHKVISIGAIFQQEGNFIVEFIVIDDSSNEWSNDTLWEVQASPSGNEQIMVDVTPSGGESQVNETVEFTVNVTSTFNHDMAKVDISFEIFGSVNSTNTTYYTDSFELQAQSSVVFNVSIKFTQTGDYKLTAVLYDDINHPWKDSFTWKVNPDDSTDDSEDTEDGGTDTPDLALPGFNLWMGLIALLSVGMITLRKQSLNY